MALQTQPVKSFLKRFLHNVKLCWNYPPSDHPGGPWHHNLYRGGGAQCVCVCLCLGKCLLTCMNMLLHLMCIDPPVTSHSCSFLFVCLFVCVSDSFTIVTLFPADSAGKHATSISCHPGSITRAECVWIHIQQRTGQCKCKHQPTHQNKGAQYASLCQSPYTCSICPLFWLESPLGHIMAASSALSSFLPLTGKGLFIGRYKHDSCLRAFLAP